MTTALAPPPAAIAALTLDPSREAHEPPEARGLRRDEVRLMVSVGDAEPVHARFDDLGRFLAAGDLLVVNTSATIAAAVDGVRPDGEPVAVHVSGQLPGGLWLVEVRRPVAGTTEPLVVPEPEVVHLAGGGSVVLLAPFADSQRLWFARFDLLTSVAGHLAHHGRPIRYRYVGRDWPLRDYQSVFSAEPGSAEMPSAARPFTPEVVADLVRRGVTFAPLLLHTGVSSLEGREAPYPERYRVPAATARLVNAAHDAGNRVVAVGTTVVRALETVTDEGGTSHPGEGWTEVVVSPERGVRAVDGLVTGWHEPEATHLAMLEAVAGTRPLELAYAAAFTEGYLWHEFGDSHLLVPYRSAR
jgi:S-adenosylmethionine:tRNA ribosyltransferase-isomerase